MGIEVTFRVVTGTDKSSLDRDTIIGKSIFTESGLYQVLKQSLF